MEWDAIIENWIIEDCIVLHTHFKKAQIFATVTVSVY